MSNDLKSLKLSRIDTSDPKDRNIVNMNRRRVNVVCDVISPNGANIETYSFAGRQIIEVWEDRVEHV